MQFICVTSNQTSSAKNKRLLKIYFKKNSPEYCKLHPKNP